MATINIPTAENLIRFYGGADSYLESQSILNQEQIAVFHPLLAPAGYQMELLFANILDVAKFATACEIKVRQNERLLKLGRLKDSQAFDSVAASFNEQAVRFAGRALHLVRQAKTSMANAPVSILPNYYILPKGPGAADQRTLQQETPLSKLSDVQKSADFPAALKDAKEAFLYNALQFNFTNNEDFTELLQIWDKTMDIASNQGVLGLFNSMEDSLNQFVSRRMTEERGTSPASPLPWWKYVVIGLYIGAAAFAVFACFFWGACTWVWGAISATAPFLFGIIDRGC